VFSKTDNALYETFSSFSLLFYLIIALTFIDILATLIHNYGIHVVPRTVGENSSFHRDVHESRQQRAPCRGGSRVSQKYSLLITFVFCFCFLFFVFCFLFFWTIYMLFFDQCKYVLLVMIASGLFQADASAPPPPPKPAPVQENTEKVEETNRAEPAAAGEGTGERKEGEEEDFWTASWQIIDAFCPSLKEDVFAKLGRPMSPTVNPLTSPPPPLPPAPTLPPSHDLPVLDISLHSSPPDLSAAVPPPTSPTTSQELQQHEQLLPHQQTQAQDNLQQASLHPASLQQAEVYHAGLQQAELQPASLQQADLHSTDLHQANLQPQEVDQPIPFFTDTPPTLPATLFPEPSSSSQSHEISIGMTDDSANYNNTNSSNNNNGNYHLLYNYNNPGSNSPLVPHYQYSTS
jgi:hypothetical protein